jgi:hypothetical protein
MSTRHYFPAAALAAGLLALSSVGYAAEEQAKPKETQNVTIEHQVEAAQTKEDHEAVAKRFDQEATRLESQAAEHTRMAKSYGAGVGVGPKGNAADLAKHCEQLAKDLQASAADAREMARLHRDLAKALAK